MTREEAIKGLTSLVEVRRKYVGMQTMKDEIECLDMAIKAIEREPILDKIRAEVEAIEAGISSYHDDRPWIFKDEALAVIDKYKTESEE